MSNTAIKIENLSKQYRLGLVGTGTLSHDLRRWWYLVRGKEDPYLKISEVNDRAHRGKSEYVWALKDINLEVKEGEVLGIIGKNGAGKSTLLKILSRITAPTTGRITYKGRIGSLLEVGTGFHQELTGRENIYLNGAILGMTKIEIDRKLDEIVDFSGVERYIDTPVKRYSSGMMVRLGFAVAAHLEPEILVVDEVLAVGDAEFQKKAIGKMQDVSNKEGRTVLFVSHNMGAVSQLCTMGAVLQDGIISYFGNADDAISFYLAQNNGESYYRPSLNSKKQKDAYFVEIKATDNNGNEKADFFYNEPIFISYKLAIQNNRKDYTIFCMILDNKQNRIFAAESCFISESMTLKIHSNFLVRGDYSIHTFIHIPRVKQEDVAENVCHFTIIDNGSQFLKHGGYNYGSVFGNYEWVKD